MKKGGLFRNRYRIDSIRYKGFDYGKNGFYFITICTKNRIHYFGSIDQNAKMIFTDIGKKADMCWRNIPNHFPFVQLDEFVVMPNHVHGIIRINKMVPVVDAHVETQNFASLQMGETINSPNKFGSQSQNIASIIRGYKIGVTMYARQANQSFDWQSRYHDHIIRNEFELNRIRLYIEKNPEKWNQDVFFKRV